MSIKSELYGETPLSQLPTLVLNILWVENSLETEFLQDILEDSDIENFELTHCLNLMDSLNAVKNIHFDVILLDLALSDARGMETVTRMCRAAEETPIVVITAIDDKVMAVQAVRAGAQDYLVKTEMESRFLAKTIHYSIERKQTEKALHQANEQLKIANTELKSLDRMKDEFIALVSHELRTPLVSILGYADALMECEIQPEEHDHFLEIIIDESNRLMRLIENVLNLSKIAAGILEFNFTQLNFDLVMKKAIQTLKILAQEKQIKFNSSTSDIQFMGDQDSIEEVLINLIGNAIKFSPKGGTIYIEHHCDQKAFRVSVRDEGPGVPDEYIEKIFDRFQQVKNDLVKEKGSGLGLAIAKYFIESHHGKIWAENTKTGAMFSFVLPFNQ